MTTPYFVQMDESMGPKPRKPVKKKSGEIASIIAKRKTKEIRVEKTLKGRTLQEITFSIERFANENDVATQEVKVEPGGWGRSGLFMVCKRMETDAEKAKRVKADLAANYESAKWNYDQWERRKARLDLAKSKACATCGRT